MIGRVTPWLVLVLAALLQVPVMAAEPDLQAGRRIFETVCAACHGTTGRLPDDSPLRAAMDPPPADLSDPLFNSREPASDWALVVAHGGHAMGLSAQMPAQGQALSPQDIGNVVAYVKTLTDTSDYPPGELNFFLPIRTKKAFPEDEVVWKLRRTDQDGEHDWRNVLEVEKRVGTRGQWLLEAVHEGGSGGRLEEVELGYKHVLGWSLAKRSILSATMVVSVPTQGDGEWALSPYVSWARQFGERWVVQSSARATVPFDDADNGTLDLAGAIHYRWSPWPRRVYPGIELTAKVPFRSPVAGDRVQYSVVPQLRFGLTRGGHVALNLGVELPLGDQAWDRQFHAVLLWDFADGSFFKGW